MNLLKHPLLIVLVPLVVFVIVASFYRFLVAGNYIVEYEGACDPLTEECFVGCVDEECSESYYFTMVRKYAADVQEQCGTDFSDCEAASVCLPSDQTCEITYCGPDTETDLLTCEHIEASTILEVPEGEVIEVDMPQEDELEPKPV